MAQYRDSRGRFISASSPRARSLRGWETRREAARIAESKRAADFERRSAASIAGWEKRREREAIQRESEGYIGGLGPGVTIEAPIYQHESYYDDDLVEWDMDYDEEWSYE